MDMDVVVSLARSVFGTCKLGVGAVVHGERLLPVVCLGGHQVLDSIVWAQGTLGNDVCHWLFRVSIKFLTVQCGPRGHSEMMCAIVCLGFPSDSGQYSVGPGSSRHLRVPPCVLGFHPVLDGTVSAKGRTCT